MEMQLVLCGGGFWFENGGFTGVQRANGTLLE
jgi:hypothetical protein